MRLAFVLFFVPFILLTSGCSAVQSTGDAVSSAGRGVGDAVSGIGSGAETVISGTGDAISNGAKRTEQKGY